MNQNGLDRILKMEKEIDNLEKTGKGRKGRAKKPKNTKDNGLPNLGKPWEKPYQGNYFRLWA